MKRTVKFLIHTLGKIVLLTSSAFFVLVFFDIQTQGFFKAVENNSVILAVELCLSVFGVLYAAYLWIDHIGFFKKKENKKNDS
jgi:hypothetical protein